MPQLYSLFLLPFADQTLALPCTMRDFRLIWRHKYSQRNHTKCRRNFCTIIFNHALHCTGTAFCSCVQHKLLFFSIILAMHNLVGGSYCCDHSACMCVGGGGQCTSCRSTLLSSTSLYPYLSSPLTSPPLYAIDGCGMCHIHDCIIHDCIRLSFITAQPVFFSMHTLRLSLPKVNDSYF